MKSRIVYSTLVLSLISSVMIAVAHEKTGWIAPEEAKKMKNPIKSTQASIQKGKEIYEKKCALCHGARGDGKGSASAGLNPRPTNFKDSHGEENERWRALLENHNRERRDALFREGFNRRGKMACDQLCQYLHETQMNSPGEIKMKCLAMVMFVMDILLGPTG